MKGMALAAARADEFRWVLRLAGALFFAGLLGVSAAIKVPLPFTPVPVTMQTFVVMMAGAALGVRWGVAAVLAYVAAGLAGAPFFAGGAGWAAFAGPTGGYLVGFVGGAAAAGLAYGRGGLARAAAFLLSLAVIYGCGLFHLAFIWGAGGREALALGFFPFALGDAAKYVLAVASFGPVAKGFNKLRQRGGIV